MTTRFGSTRVHRWPGEGAEVVLLHGVGDTSFRWLPFAEALPELDVYAIDIMGDVGNSEPAVGFESGDDFGIWLGDTLGSLGLTSPHIAGMSLGGYVALSHAVQGGAATSIVLYDPVGLVKLRMGRFVRWGAATDVPVRVVAGAKSPPFDGAALVQRAADSIEHAYTRLLPDAGHALAMTHGDVALHELREAVAGDRHGSTQ